MGKLSLREVQGLVSIGSDSIVFPCPGDPNSILKIYDNLNLSEVLEYNMIHGKYGSKGEVEIPPDGKFLENARLKGWGIMFLGRKIKGCVVKVLDLSVSELTEDNEGHTFAKIPLVKGTNLANHLKSTKDEQTEYALRMLENMAYSGLKLLGLPIEEKTKGGKIIKRGHNIGRDNLMITGINKKGIVEITATDIGFYIPQALQIERELNGQNAQSR